MDHQEKINKRLKELEDEKKQNLLAISEGRLKDVSRGNSWMINEQWNVKSLPRDSKDPLFLWISGPRRMEHPKLTEEMFVLTAKQAIEKQWVGYNNQPVVLIKEVTKEDFPYRGRMFWFMRSEVHNNWSFPVSIGKQKGILVRPLLFVFTSPHMFHEVNVELIDYHDYTPGDHKMEEAYCRSDSEDNLEILT